MLKSTLKAIGSGSPRVLPNWDKYVMMIKLRSQIMYTRYLQTGFLYNPSTSLLIHILSSAVTPMVLNCKSDYRRYVEFIDPITPVYRGMFDPAYKTLQNKNVFTVNNVAEIILNVSMDKPLTSLPMDKPWEEWKDLAPVHVIYHDARELITDLYKFRLEFKHHEPSCVFYSIDLVMLIFKYIKFIEYGKQTGFEATPEMFLQHHVFNHWFEDLQRIWLFQILQDVVKDGFDYTNFKSNELVAPNIALKTISSDMYHLLDACRKKSIGIGDICATKWFGEYSLKYWLDELNTNLQLPQLRQYKWMEFTSTLPYASFVLDTMCTIGRKDLVLLIRNLMFDLHQYKNQNICSNIYNSYYRSMVTTELERIENRVTDMGSL